MSPPSQKSTNPSELKILWVSDIHLGHHNTPTDHILRVLKRIIPDNATMDSFDMVVIAGDLFDRLLQWDELQVDIVTLWMIALLRVCKARDIVLRVLKGTPSHDWDQSAKFIQLNAFMEIGADVVYVDKLEIEYIERFGIHVLYVPDELNPSSDTTWVQVTELMQRHNLTQVDYSVVHGGFEHQYPPHLHDKQDLHKSDRYCDITRCVLFIGHIHQHSQYRNALAAGSVDRLCHGDEAPKGHIVTQGSDWQFIVNKHARIYKTIDCIGLDHAAALKRINDVCSKLPHESFVRIHCARTDAAWASLPILRNEYPHLTFSSKEAGKTERNALVVRAAKPTFHRATLTKDGIATALLERIAKRSPELVAQCKTILEEFIDGG